MKNLIKIFLIPLLSFACINLYSQANDLCANATTLTCGASLVGEDTTGSTDQSADIGCSMGTGVWYTIVGTGDNITIAITNDAFDVEVGVASGACGALTNISCTDGGVTSETVTFPSVIGTTYYIYIGDWSTGGTDAGTYDLAVTCVPPPMPAPNDMCADAIALTVNADLACGTVTNATILGATDSGLDVPPEDNTVCGGTEDDDVWFSFVATNTIHQIDLINITGSTTDLYHSVWEGSCGALTNIICSDPNTSTLVGLTVGNTYYVRIYSWTATGGQDSVFDVCIGTPPPPPPGDECSDPLPYPGDVAAGTCVTGFDFTPFSDNGNPSPTCDFGGDAVVWFSWTAPIVTVAGDPIDVEFDGGDGQANNCNIGIEVYETDCTTPASNCLGNISGVLTGLTQGTDYVILIYDDSPAEAVCDFCLSVACTAPTATATAICVAGDEDNFYIELDVTSMGFGNTAYTLDVAGAQANVTAVGTTMYGPFPSGTPIDVILTGVDDTACGLTVAGLDKDCTCDPLSVEAVEDGLVCPGAPFNLSATLNEVIPGEFIDYTVTPSAPGSCTAVPDNAADCVDLALGDDAGSGPIPLGFSFEFFGVTYTDVCVGSNGYVTFACIDETDLSEDAIPSPTDPNAIVALFWDDLNPTDAISGLICTYESTIGGQTCLVVDYQNIAHFGGGETITGQIIICPDNTVTINCIDCQSDGGTDTAVQGIEDETGTTGYFDPAFPDGVVPGAATTSNCVTYTPNYSLPAACTFVGWVTDINDVAGTTVATTNPATVNPTMTTTYYAMTDCDGVPCFDEVTVTMDIPANCLAECPIVTTAIAGEETICTGDTPVLDIASLVLDDASLAVGGGAVTWYLDAGLTMVYGGGALTHSGADNCATETVTFFAAVECIEDGSIIAAGSTNVVVFPAFDATLITITAGDCTTAPSVTSTCGNYIVVLNGDADDITGIPAPGASGTNNYTVTWFESPACWTQGMVEVPYNCNLNCPAVTTPIAGAEDICEGASPTLDDSGLVLNDASLAVGGGTVSWWEDAVFTIPYGGSVSYSGDGCAPSNVILFASVECIDDGSIIAAGQVAVTIYPDYDPSTLTIIAGDCMTAPSVVSTCGNYVVTLDGDADDITGVPTPGQFGTNNYTITYTGAPACWVSGTVEVPYNCSEVDCAFLIANDIDICQYLLDNPGTPVGALDCDLGGVSNAVECAAGGDPVNGADDCDADNGEISIKSSTPFSRGN